MGDGRFSEREHAQPLEPGRIAPAPVLLDVGRPGRLHADRGEPSRKPLEAVTHVLVVVRQGHENGAVDARPLHLAEQLLGRRLELGREQLVDIAREAVGDSRKDVRVRVDDHQDAST